MKTVVLISDNSEWTAVKTLLAERNLKIDRYPFGERFHVQLGGYDLDFFHGGWGKIAAAASAQYVIDHSSPDLLVNLGTCGGFEGRIQPGTIVLVERTVVYDMIEQITDAAAAINHYASSLDLSWLAGPEPHPISRGLMASGDRDIQAADIPMLIEKYDAVAGDWESAAIAWVAKRNATRLLILRGVSDLVGSRGGEAYGNEELFHQRTYAIMTELLRQLPDWLGKVKP